MEWKYIPCGLNGSPVDWNYQNLHNKAPISIYFPLGDSKVDLDIKRTVHKKGRRLKYTETTIKLNPGDLLLFNTTTCCHWTARPGSGIQVEDRVNIMLTGLPEVLQEPPPPLTPKRSTNAQSDNTDTETESE